MWGSFSHFGQPCTSKADKTAQPVNAVVTAVAWKTRRVEGFFHDDGKALLWLNPRGILDWTLKRFCETTNTCRHTSPAGPSNPKNQPKNLPSSYKASPQTAFEQFFALTQQKAFIQHQICHPQLAMTSNVGGHLDRRHVSSAWGTKSNLADWRQLLVLILEKWIHFCLEEINKTFLLDFSFVYSKKISTPHYRVFNFLPHRRNNVACCSRHHSTSSSIETPRHCSCQPPRNSRRLPSCPAEDVPSLRTGPASRWHANGSFLRHPNRWPRSRPACWHLRRPPKIWSPGIGSLRRLNYRWWPVSVQGRCSTRRPWTSWPFIRRLNLVNLFQNN